MNKNLENFPHLQTLQEDLENIKEVVKKPEVPHTYQEKFETILSTLDELLAVEKDIETQKIEKQLEEFQEVTKELIELKAIKELSDSSDTIEKHLKTLKQNKHKDSRFKRNRKKLTLGTSLVVGGLVANKYLKGANIDKIKEFFKKFPEKIKKLFAGLGTIGTKIKGRRKEFKSKVKTKWREIFHPKEVINELEDQIEFLKAESVPLRFKILEEKNGHTKVRLNFYDREDNKIKSIDKTLKGTGLMFDFLIAPMQLGVKKDNGEITQMPKASLAFPHLIYTSSIARNKSNIDIRKEYDKNGLPEVFNDSELSEGAKTTLKEQYKIAQSDEEKPEGRIGSLVTDARDAGAGFKVGKVYKIVSHTKGGLEIMKDNDY